MGLELLKAEAQAGEKTIKVDLSDLAKDASDSRSFDLYVERVSLFFVGGEIQLETRSTTDGKLDHVSHLVKHLLRESSSAIHSAQGKQCKSEDYACDTCRAWRI